MGTNHEVVGESGNVNGATGWEDVAAMANELAVAMSGEEHEAIPSESKTLEVYNIKGGDNSDIVAKLAENGFEEVGIRYNSYPGLGGYETGVLRVYNVKGDLALKYTVFSGAEKDEELYNALFERKNKLDNNELVSYVDLSDDYKVDIFNDEELHKAEENAKSIEEQSRELYDNAEIAGEYKVVDFTNLRSQESAERAQYIIWKEKVSDAPDKDGVKMIFLERKNLVDTKGMRYMDVEVAQPDLSWRQMDAAQSVLPYGTDVNTIKHDSYGTGGIFNVPVTEKEKLVQVLRDNYEREQGAK